SQWSDTVFQSNGNIALGGASQNGILYYAVIGSFVPPDINNLILSGWFPGYSKSTDNGANWSDFQVIDFRTIPALSAFDRLWDYIKGDAFISYQGDVNADKDGYVHIVTGVTDTIGSNNSGRNALVEIFETSGGWDGKIIADNLSELTFTKLTGPALGQMGPCAYIAANKNKDVFAASWVAGSPSAGDSLCDVYFSYRSMDGEWSAAQNLTETDGMNENSSHFAPTLAEGNNPGEYIAFSFYNYEAGNTSYDIVEDNPSVIYIAPVPFMILTGVSDDNFSPFSFKLEQNYPNPFNPTTKIKYVIPNVVDAKFASTTLVILKIYDILGNEVATIVNKEQQPGNYEVEFNAKNLSSGIYFYKISARNFHQTKKMVLMK
ncbi:MAG: T9SS type A sorting domain-containing protein, partial [Ignavibacteriaceae bacterium]